MRNTFKAVNGTYGASKKPCTVFVCENEYGSSWYAVEDSININATMEEIEEGVNVEQVNDFDTVSADNLIQDLEDFKSELENI